MASQRKNTPAGGSAPSAWNEFKDQVRAACRLEDVVGADAQLAKGGRELTCCSPLREDDDTPSFSVNVEKQVWVDRGTGQGGDVFAYVMSKHSLAFPDAVRFLAGRAGIPTPASSPGTEEDERLDEERQLVEKILTEAAAIYHAALDDQRRGFLRAHYGFTDKLINEQKLGYDPGGTHLWYELKKAGHSDEDLFRSGLFVEGTSHVGASRFHHRITMPYWRRGAVVYLCARATKDTPKIPKRKDGNVVRDQDGSCVLQEPAKYFKLKTNDDDDGRVEGELPSSISKTISNEWFAGEDSCDGATDFLLIAEGMPDYLSIKQAGFSVISPVTVRFRTEDHEKLLRLCRRAKKVVLVPDQEANGAGMSGATETATVLANAGLDVRILVLPHDDLRAAARARIDVLKGRTEPAAREEELKDAADWKIDANEFLRAHPDGVEFRKLVDQARPFIDFLIGEIPESVSGKELDAALRPVLALVARLPSPIERDRYLERLKTRFKVKKSLLQEMIRGAVDDDEREDAADDDSKTGALLELLSGVTLIRAATGRVFAVFGAEAIPTDSPVFTRRIARLFHLKTGKLVGTSSIETALLLRPW